MAKMWDARFSKEENARVNDFNSSISFDSRMFREDIAGSVAHAAMLGKQGIIAAQESEKIIATNTVNSIQAGLFFGYTAMVDGLVAQMKAEAGEDPPVIATGGLSAVIASGSSAIDRVDPLLAMKGLRILYERNR